MASRKTVKFTGADMRCKCFRMLERDNPMTKEFYSCTCGDSTTHIPRITLDFEEFAEDATRPGRGPRRWPGEGGMSRGRRVG